MSTEYLSLFQGPPPPKDQQPPDEALGGGLLRALALGSLQPVGPISPVAKLAGLAWPQPARPTEPVQTTAPISPVSPVEPIRPTTGLRRQAVAAVIEPVQPDVGRNVPLRIGGIAETYRGRAGLNTTVALLDTRTGESQEEKLIRFALSDRAEYEKNLADLGFGYAKRATLIPKDVLTEAEVTSLVRQFTRSALSLFVWLADILDKPRAAAAGLLAGQPSQILHILPFSGGWLKGFYEGIIKTFIPSFQWNPEKRVFGRDLLEMYGIVPKRQGRGLFFGGSMTDLVGDVLGLAVDFILGGIVPYPAIARVGTAAKMFGRGLETPLAAEAATHAQRIAAAITKDPRIFVDVVRSNFSLSTIARYIDLPLESPAFYRGEVSRILQTAAAKVPGLRETAERAPRLAQDAFLSVVTQHTDDLIRQQLHRAAEGQKILHSAAPTQWIEEVAKGERAVVLTPGWPFHKLLTREGYYARLFTVPKRMEETVRQAGRLLFVENPVAAFIHGLFHWTSRGVGRAGVSAVMDATEIARNVRGIITDVNADVSHMLGVLAGRWQAMADEARFFGDLYQGMTFDSLVRYAVETARIWGSSMEETARLVAQQVLENAPPEKIASAAKIIGQAVEHVQAVHQRIQNHLLSLLAENGAPVSQRVDPFGLTHLVRIGKGAFGGEFVWPTRRMVSLTHPAGTVAINRMSMDPIISARIGATAKTVYRSGYQAGTPAVLNVGGERRFAVLEEIIGDQDVKILRFWDGQRYYSWVVPGVELSEVQRTYLAGTTMVDEFRLLSEPPPDVKLPRIFTTPKEAERAARRFATERGWAIPKNVDPVYFYAWKRYFEPFVQIENWQNAFNPITGRPNKELIPVFFAPDEQSAKEAISILTASMDLRRALGLTTKRDVERFVASGGVVGALVDALRRAGPYDELLFNRSLSETFEVLYYYASQRLGLLLASQDYIARTATLAPGKPTIFARVIGAFEHDSAMVPLKDARQLISWWHEPASKAGGLPLTEKWTQRIIERWLAMQNKTWKEVVPEAESIEQAYRILSERLYVPRYAVKHMARVFALKDIIEQNKFDYQTIWDRYLTLMRYWLTQISPAFHVRNFVSSQVMNLTADAPYTFAQYRDALVDVLEALAGRKKLPFDTEIASLDILSGVVRAADPTRSYTVAQGGLGWVFEPLARELTKRVTHTSEALFRPSKRAAEVQSRFARNQSFGAATEQFLAAIRATTDRAYSLVETLARVTPYIAARRAGLTASQAVELVKRIQYDYTRLTPFEQRVMKPLFLFYGWLRSNIGHLIPKTTIEAWSGAAALLRLLYAAQETAGTLPAWMRETAAIPFRQTEEEASRGLTTVIRKWGLHVEDLSLLHPTVTGPGAVRMLQKTISSMNPIVGAVFRLATGIEPYTGRPLKETAGITGVPLLDVAIGVTPLARISAMLRTTAEVLGYSPYRREWTLQLKLAPLLDLLTGIKTGEYDLDLQLLLDAREALRREIELSPFSRSGLYVYVPEHLKPFAPDWLIENLEKYNRLARLAREVARRRRGRDVVAIREVTTPE